MLQASDGRIAMTFGDGTTNGIATINADGSDYREIVEQGPRREQPHGGTEAPRWTPDGRILFDSNRSGGPDDWHIFVVEADGGDPIQLTEGDDGIENYPVMSADGSVLVYSKYLATPEGPGPFGGGGIFLSHADGSNERQLTSVPPGATPEFPEGAVDEWPDISPDGQRIVFTRGHSPEGGLYIVNSDGTGFRQLIDANFQALRPRWSPDGEWIVLHGNGGRFQIESANVWVIAPDGTGLRQLTFETVPGQAWAPDWSPDGQRIVFTHDADAEIMDLTSSSTCTLRRPVSGLYPNDSDWGPAETPATGGVIVGDEEEWIVFGRQSTEPDGRSTGSQYLARPDGSGEHRLINNVIGSELRATWSPDGDRLAYVQGTLDEADQDQGGLWIIDADGTNEHHVVGCEARCVAIDYVDWAPDGNTIYFERHSNAPDPESPPATFQIWSYDLATGEAGPVLTREGDGMTVEQPRVSPDGTHLVYFRQRYLDPGSPSAIFVADLNGGPERRLTDWELYAAHPDWSVDDLIVFNSYDQRLYDAEEFPGPRDLYVIRPDGTDLRRLTSNETGGVRSVQPRWTPNGFGITYTEWTGDVSLLAYIGADGNGQRPLTSIHTVGGEPEVRPTANLTGEWSRETRCEEIVAALRAAGFSQDSMLEYAAAFVPGASVGADIVDPGTPCSGAVPLRHSHFFTNDGRFGSRDENGVQVDDGTYKIIDSRTVVISNAFGGETQRRVTFHYQIDGDTITFEPVIPDCRPDCFEAIWSVTVAYPGLPWVRRR
jgi:Tol biopolymer transport system component